MYTGPYCVLCPCGGGGFPKWGLWKIQHHYYYYSESQENGNYELIKRSKYFILFKILKDYENGVFDKKGLNIKIFYFLIKIVVLIYFAALVIIPTYI